MRYRNAVTVPIYPNDSEIITYYECGRWNVDDNTTEGRQRQITREYGHTISTDIISIVPFTNDESKSTQKEDYREECFVCEFELFRKADWDEFAAKVVELPGGKELIDTLKNKT
jgi:hypothetical protein